VYNYIGLEPRREAMHWQFGEMKFGEMKRKTSNWSNFCMLLRRAGLTASAGLSCFITSSLAFGPKRRCTIMRHRSTLHKSFFSLNSSLALVLFVWLLKNGAWIFSKYLCNFSYRYYL